jgi:hypothetical protein
MVENNDEHWVENFMMTKDKLFTLLNVEGFRLQSKIQHT